MRLLYVTQDAERVGGLARSVRRVSHHLAQTPGIDVRVISLEAEASIDTLGRDATFSGLLYQAWVDCTIEACEEFAPDVVVGYHGAEGGFAAVAAGRQLGIPSVAALRGNDVNLNLFSPLTQHLVKFAVTRADAVTVVSTEMATKVRSWLGADSVFIANAVDRSRFRADPDGAAALRERWGITPGPVVGLFGEFKPSRGFGKLAVLEDALAPATAVLVGEVRTKFRKLIPSWVHTVPYVNDDLELRAAYSLCDLVLQPSDHDGMPNTVLEAMACERVVVASGTGGLLDVIRHGTTGFLCRRDEWPRTVRQLLDDPPANVGPAARLSLTSPEDEAAAFLRVFEAVANG